ncbi:MAG TPA: hypothetical protein VLD35_13460 [Caldimonas sp.]|nr:hypothetical protein [Caldimonas sp.]
MNSRPTAPEQGPGHYGAGHGEQVPEDAPPQPAPLTDDNTAPTTSTGGDTPGSAATTSAGDDGNPVVFTPDDVGVRPPDHPPTKRAPESEKAGLIFERS